MQCVKSLSVKGTRLLLVIFFKGQVALDCFSRASPEKTLINSGKRGVLILQVRVCSKFCLAIQEYQNAILS